MLNACESQRSSRKKSPSVQGVEVCIEGWPGEQDGRGGKENLPPSFVRRIFSM